MPLCTASKAAFPPSGQGVEKPALESSGDRGPGKWGTCLPP